MAFRRIRALIGHAHSTLSDAEALIALSQALVADLQDGVGVKVLVGEHALATMGKLMVGQPGELPFTVCVDPTLDTLPAAQCTFDGGSHDGKTYSLNPYQRSRKSITLKPGETYVWDGYKFVYDGVSDVSRVEE